MGEEPGRRPEVMDLRLGEEGTWVAPVDTARCTAGRRREVVGEAVATARLGVIGAFLSAPCR